MSIASIVNNAFRAAKSKPVEGTDRQQLHRNRSREWVETLADEFRKSYEGESNVRVFSKHNESNRTEFGMNELLYDVLVCRVATTTSAKRGAELFYVEEALWQVESEFARNSREALFDFNKLVIGSAKSKLFIGPQVNDAQAFLDVLRAPAQHCTGDVYVALVPHPKEWDGDQVHIPVWQLSDGEWVARGESS